MNKEKYFIVISTIVTIAGLLLTGSTGIFSTIANAQSPSCDNGELKPSTSSHPLPVILLHGYSEVSSVWANWEDYLLSSGIQFCTVSFHPDDVCGTAVHDATEIGQIVQKVKSMTHQNQVNIVAHSKGGLDARLYLAKSGTHDVANLIMLGTPNKGSPFGDGGVYYNFDRFCPALRDLTTHASVINASQNLNTKYYTIAGACLPYIATWWGSIDERNDGLVGVSSVRSQTYFENLPLSSHCHWQLMGAYEFELAYNILAGRQ